MAQPPRAGLRVGSRYTGHTVLAAVSRVLSGVSVTAVAVAVTPIGATCAPSPGPAAVEATGMPVAASRVAPVFGSVMMPSGAVGVAESHISGVGAVNTARPGVSVAVMFPAGSAATLTPAVWMARVRGLSAGFAAAAASWTMRTSENPPWVLTVTCRSTPGSTAG